MSAGTGRGKPLAGVRVLEKGRVYAAPWAAMPT